MNITKLSANKMVAGAVAAATLLFGGLATSVVLTGPATAGAAPAATAPAAKGTKPAKPGLRLRRALRRHVVEISAKTIGVAPKDLVASLKQGKSIADVATSKGVDPQKVVDALVKAGDARIDKAVANHRLSPDQAAKLKAKLPTLAGKVVNHHRKVR